jgi:CheY-like chemotaxis protein
MFLDVKMPGMDGVEVIKQAKEMRPELPVVMITAYATVENAVVGPKYPTNGLPGSVARHVAVTNATPVTFG